MPKLFTEISGLKAITFALVFLACLLAGAHSGLNAERASHGCGEYSSQVSMSGFSALILLLGSYAVVLFIEITWSDPAARIASFLVNLGYVLFIIFSLIHDRNAHYAPCDRKGDESSEFIYLIGAMILPFIWLGLFAIISVFRSIKSKVT